jgi:hypothetical protein
MKKLLFTSACDPRETEWQRVLELTTPRMKRYAERHGYDFRMAWYGDIDHQRFPEFKNPGPFIGDAAGRGDRLNFILWKYDRSMLAPNWLRYAVTMQALDEYDLVMYMDGDLLIGDMETDIFQGWQEGTWIASAISGPNPPHDAGPGGPLYLTRGCPEAKAFWLKVWQGRKWITHPEWTDGVDVMDMLGYSITSPVHKIRATEYDSAFAEIPRDWVVWGREPGPGKGFHMGGGNADPASKAGAIARIIKERGL